MENLKIRVNSEAESKEAQELLFKLGAKKVLPDIVCFSKNVRAVCCICNSVLVNTISFESCSSELKEITLPELRVMVDPMKEYLDKKPDGSYELIVSNGGCVDRDWIAIPEGAIRARFYPHDPDEIEFENAFRQWWHDENQGWFYYNNYAVSEKHSRIVWQRESDQDEPFLTPECTLNDQYAEIEEVRQALKDNVNHPSHYADSTIECIDAMEAMMAPEQFIGYLRGNLFKYQWRYEKKNGIEDLKKAQWYLEKLTVKIAEKNAPF